MDDPMVRGFDSARCAVDEVADAYGLTPRERDVLALLMQGRDGVAVHRLLGISYNTVKTHLKHLYGKCGVASRQQLVSLVRGDAGLLSA